MTSEHVPALHVALGVAHLMAWISATPLRLYWERTRVMAGALCHCSLDPALSEKRKLIGNVRIPRVFKEEHAYRVFFTTRAGISCSFTCL